MNQQQVQLHYYRVRADGWNNWRRPCSRGRPRYQYYLLTTVDAPGNLEAYIYVPVEHSTYAWVRP